MPTFEQYQEYADTVVAFLRRGQKKMNRQQMNIFKHVEAGLGKMGESKAALAGHFTQEVEIAWQTLNKQLAETTVMLIKTTHQAEAKRCIEGNLLATNDTEEDVQRKLNALREYTGVKPRPVAQQQPQAPVTEPVELFYKIALIGDTQVGKTTLARRYVHDVFVSPGKPTIAVDFLLKNTEVEKTPVKLQFWDIAGDERFSNMLRVYLADTKGMILAYDTTKRSSFNNLTAWIEKIEKNFRGKAPIVLVGTKSDLADKREVTTEEAKAFADAHGWGFVETSAKGAQNVDLAFETLAKRIVKPEVNTPVQTPLKNTDLAAALQDKAWYSITSFGAGTPAGFKQILTALKKKPALKEEEFLAKIHEIAGPRAKPVVRRRFFPNGTRDPLLMGVYKQLLAAKTVAEVAETLQQGLADVKLEQATLKMMR